MPYNPQVDATQIISKEHRRMLKVVSKATGKLMRRILEDYIEKEYAKVNK